MPTKAGEQGNQTRCCLPSPFLDWILWQKTTIRKGVLALENTKWLYMSVWIHIWTCLPISSYLNIISLQNSFTGCPQTALCSCSTGFFSLWCPVHIPLLLPTFTCGYLSLFTCYSFVWQTRVASSWRPGLNRILGQVRVHLYEVAFSYKHKQSWEIWTQFITTRQLDK